MERGCNLRATRNQLHSALPSACESEFERRRRRKKGEEKKKEKKKKERNDKNKGPDHVIELCLCLERDKRDRSSDGTS